MRHRGMLLIGIPALGAAVGGGWFFRQQIGWWWYEKIVPAAALGTPKPVPDATKYAVIGEDLEHWRKDLSARYEKAGTPLERAAIEHDARVILEDALPAMMRCWLGTPWDFEGTADGPGKGKIACGYFVATVLKDAGFRVDRYRLAQQPSQYILETFIEKKSCTLTMGYSYDAFTKRLADAPPGVYVIGLDTHVGFLIIGENGFRMIHSSGSAPWCVVDEGQDEAQALKKSNWRMIGNFTADPGVLRSWLRGKKSP